MKVLIITSCTGEKLLDHPDKLTPADFQQEKEHIHKRELSLSQFLTPAEKMYTGQQHVRLMRGIETLRGGFSGHTVDLWVLSAGYGLIPGDRPIAPYECTFIGMGKSKLKSWADKLSIPDDIRKVFSQPYDLGLVLLGDSYLKACAFDATVRLGGPTIFFCGTTTAARLPELDRLKKVILSNKEARRFSCGLVALKGEMARRILDLVQSNSFDPSGLADKNLNILDLLDHNQKQSMPATVDCQHF